jgi:hypothetical protein
MSGQSPLKAKPLRLPGESVDEEIVHLRENALMDYLFVGACVFLLALNEWFGYFMHTGRHPWAFTLLLTATLAYVVPKILKLRQKLGN